jgi:hypothetical protein
MLPSVKQGCQVSSDESMLCDAFLKDTKIADFLPRIYDRTRVSRVKSFHSDRGVLQV